ncbi:sensor domain-containing protein [Legionella maioricensis]|uniref:EAL domain-containing protein n=1 Tax=Legionella maioricensis TaxID=2896528 RepID=A0A9X2CYR5_9GAMM|nr:bifunctional diguanylate cyclase/phosphodiesterase [Legionella maioricensis]MCL9683159.1 EAL domain-containing protein [Legionella maioricensis]MCL9688058.1 EAL domain-containing protein [Legionella maioricensis]
MLDKKSGRELMSLSHGINSEGPSTHKLERELMSRLIDFCHADASVRSFSEHTLTLLNKHPLLKDKITGIWRYDLEQISIIAPEHLNSDIQEELERSPPRIKKWQSLKISYASLRTQRIEKITSRIDICLEKAHNNLFYFSIWSELSKEVLKLLTPFLKSFFGVFNVCLLNILNKKRVKLLNTILERAVDSIEITNEEAVIQYVNPAFERITLYKAFEAINKTVASLLRSPKEDERLFEHIKQELEAGNTWHGRIKSRKKDGSDWIAQTVIVPVVDDESGKITQHIAIKQDITEQVNYLNQLKISEERYRNLMNAASDAIFIHDLNGLFLETNTAACKSLGYSAEELRRCHVWDIEVGASPEVLNQMWLDLQNGPIKLEGRHRRKDGTTFPVDVRLGIFNATGEKLVLAIVRDISVQKQSEATIKQLTRALEQSPIFVLITDRRGTIEYANAKVMEQTGYSPEEILGQNPRVLQSGHTPPETYQNMWSHLIRGDEWRGELLNKNKKGELFWVSAIISPLRDENEITHYLAVMEDISQKKSYEEMLKHHATYDNLTNLPNRLYGYSRLEHAVAKAQVNKKKLAVLFLDLDEFKHINDSLGHAVGDLLLKALSERYLSIIRQTDTIARLGGDEFMMILENLNHVGDAELVAKKCLEVCLRPFVIESHKLSVSSSIGIAVFPEHGKDAKTLMRNADAAMYQSKLNNKNNWTVFISTMANVASNRIRIKAELDQAMLRDELYLCYQPIIDIRNNTLFAAEALLRWQSPTLGYVLPDQIIPIAEETGLIVDLGYWIFKKVCIQVKEWQITTGKNLKVAVNISTQQLKQNDFVNKIKLILKETALSPESLIFEITESAFLDDSKFILSQLDLLNEMGIHCSLSDFGMNYSSLKSWHSYPFKILKIDRSFIQGVNTNNNDLSLVNSIIAMSRNLKLTVVAEGVETIEQLKLMRTMNCDMVQGWYFSEALSSEQFLLYLNNQLKNL